MLFSAGRSNTLRMAFVTDFDEPKLEQPSFTSQLVDVLHAAALASPQLYETKIVPVLLDVIPDLPATAPLSGQPLEWLDLRPLLLSAFEYTKQRVDVLSKTARGLSELSSLRENRDHLPKLQELIAKPLFVAATTASSTLPPAASASGSSDASAASAASAATASASAASAATFAPAASGEHSGAKSDGH
jgi:hypothetical protein